VRGKGDAGVTLVEILFAIVIIGVAVSALFAGLGTGALSSKSHRDLATADTVLRSYAEAAKAAVRSSCTSSGGSYTIAYTPPSGYTVNSLGSQSCPAVTTVQQLHLTVTVASSGITKSLDINLRTA
jgi:prepilin-type N-terminal cleavage/methylation domain-containing protein